MQTHNILHPPDGCSPLHNVTAAVSAVALCSGHGQCESTTNGLYCACQHGYTGRFCELSK